MNDSLMQICGVNTTFDAISCDYRIFSCALIHQSIDNAYVEDWDTLNITSKIVQLGSILKISESIL